MTRLKTIFTILALALGELAYGQLTSKFSADTTSGCTPVTVQFKDQSAGSVSSYYWTFGNGNTSTKKNPSAIFYKPGVYTVSLKVTDASGKSDTRTETAYIEVFALPKADFSPLKKSGCAPLDVPFTNSSTKGSGGIDRVTWDFGDGNTLISKTGFHRYKVAGLYSVSLLVVDSNKCKDKITKKDLIDVWPVPEVDFEADETYSCQPPLDVKFTNRSKKNSGDTYHWDFGDGKTSTNENPDHTFSKTGSYTVKLTVTNSKGCKTTKTMKSYININPLKVDFDISDFDGCAPLDVAFTNKTTPAVSGLTYKWDLGNGQTAQTKNVGITYDNPGTYTISLSVSKNGKCGQKKTLANAVNVKPSPKPEIKLSDSTSCKLPFVVDVEDVGTGASSWTWYLNGVTRSSGKKTQITISSYGEHVIGMQASNTYGCSSDTIRRLLRAEPIEVTITPDTSGCVPLTVTFKNTSNLKGKKITKQEWSFGDGATKTINGDSPLTASHTYNSDGVYSASLTVTTSEGCVGTAAVEVKVGKKVEPKIEPGLDTFCNAQDGRILNFIDSKYKDSLDAVHWSLIPKTGKTGIDRTVQRPLFPVNWDFIFSIQEQDTGYYDVRLITEDRGCKDTTILRDRIYVSPPIAKLTPLHDTCANDIMILANRSEHYDSINWVVNNSVHLDTLIRIGTDTAKVAWLRAYNHTSGCIDSVPFQFVPKETFDEGFSSTGELCAPTTFQFVGYAHESFVAHLWVINKTDSFFGRFLTLPMDQPGSYTIYHEVKDTSKTGGCAKVTEKVIDVTGPTVSGSIEGTAGCGPIDVKLKTTSDPKDFAQLFWTVGSDTFRVKSAGSQTIELYKPGPDDGKWPITLIGVDSNGCRGSEKFDIEVYGTKNAELKISRFEDCSGRKFIFSPKFNTPVDDENWTYKWDMGDGSGTSDLKVVNYTFAKAGKYAVKVFITDEKGCVTRLQDTVDMEEEVLTARFFADSLIKDCPPLHVGFEDRSTVNNLRKIVKWEWYFGDGTTSQERYPSKLYLVAGNFDVSLKVTDEWGCKDSFTYPSFVLVNGPKGSYVFDKTEGCVPLDVTFTADTSNCTGFTWDFGDGNVLKNQLTYTHTYHDTGRFIPLLTLADTFGCTYTHPPIDTIYVYPNPKPDFTLSRPCPGVPTDFTNMSWPSGALSSSNWEFGDGETSDDFNPQHIYTKGGVFPVKLTVATLKGCVGDTTKNIVIKNIVADFTTSKSEVCLGSEIDVVSTSASDTSLVSWDWTFNDTIHFSGPDPSLTFSHVGPVQVRLIVEDAIGCTDTLKSSTLLTVGDTVPPLPTSMLRVSVTNNGQYLVDYKPSTIKDFKSYLIYHNDGLVGEVDDRDQTRYLVNGVNTLHNVYCAKVAVRNACGLISEQLIDSNDCTVEVSAKGEVNQSRLNWNHYYGWQDVETYYVYREEDGNPGNFLLLDSVPGNTLEYVDTNILCYRTHRYKILAKEYQGNGQVSWSDTCEATPIYINSLPPNELVRATVQHDEYVRIEWLPTPYSKMPIDHYVLEKSFDGVDYRYLSSTSSQDDLVAEDRLVEVDSQSYYYRVRAVDVCKDESPYSNLAKTILLKADTGKFQRPYLTWSTYKGWDVGVDKYEIQRKEEDGSFFSLGYTDSGDDTTYYDRKTALNERPHFCYRVIGHKVTEANEDQIVSISNEDCIDVHSWLYVPNAFSPNGDGLNDYFLTPGWYIKEYHISIYTRWGEKIFESESMYRNWHGDYKGEIVENEAYLYIIETIGIDGIKRNYKGTVTVLR
ncbi:MAG: PKD domain-containing protein [Bacteroidia bacterium]|nr:PKD domain-containing protein [Bacteroidia bacterium]